MKFCSQCAHPVAFIVPPDDHLPRYICPQCGMIHYQNPRMVVCAIPVWEQTNEFKIMLCRRAIEPRHGYWTLPGGFMENNETTVQTAQRETLEEAGAAIEVDALFSMINLPRMHQVQLFYRARLADLIYEPGVESLEVKLLAPDEIPWDQIAFTTVSVSLKFFLDDLSKVRAGGVFGFHTHDILESRFDHPSANLKY